MWGRSSNPAPITGFVLAALGILSSQHEASRRCLGNEPVAFVRDLALDVAQAVPAAHNFSLGLEVSLPDGTEEIDLQFHGCKGFSRRECAREGHSHRGIRNVAQNSAVERTHGVCVLWSSRQRDRSSSFSNLFSLKSYETCNRHIVCLRPCSEIRFDRYARRAHDSFALRLNSFARTLVSKYSSR